MTNRRSAGRLVAAAAAALLASQVGAAVGAAPGAAPTPTQNVQATKADVNPNRTYSAPNLAVDPSNPLVIVGAFAEVRTRRCGLIRSTDGGQTWKILDASPSPNDYPSCNSNPRGTFHAYVRFGNDGALYYAMDGWDVQDGGVGQNVSIVVSKSTDLGDHWQPVVARNARGKTDEAREANRPVTGFAVDGSGKTDILIVGASRRWPGFSGANSLPNQPIVVISTDGGKTFGEPVDLAAAAFSDAGLRQTAFKSTTTVPNATTTTALAGTRAAVQDQAANFGGFGPSIAVDDKGTIYAGWPATYANLAPRPAGGLLLSKSTDHGKTWTTTQVAPFSFNTGSFVSIAWSPQGGAGGTLFAVSDGFEDPATAGWQDIYIYRSTDGGKTWSDRKNVTDDDPKAYVSQFYPNISVAPNGRVDVTFFDARSDPGTRSNDVYYTYSEDNGQTWSKNVRITDRSSDRTIGVWANNADVNSPPGLASTNEYALFAWDDTRNGDSIGQAQDIYAADMQFSTVGASSSSKTAKIIVAGVIGLLAVGLVLLLATNIAKGNRGGPPSAPAADKAKKAAPAAKKPATT